MSPVHSRLAREPILLYNNQKPYGAPPELWLHVFYFLKDERLDLTGLAMVSKSFVALAQPLLFQHIAVRPVCDQQYASGRLTCRADSLAEVTERMRFCAQERIAHGVTTIELSPTINYCVRRDAGGEEFSAVADVVIRMLPLFPRLRSFQCAHLVLQPHHVSTISGTTNLRSFHTINCHLSDSLQDHTHESPMEDFTVSWQGDTTKELGVALSPHSHQRWFSFMHPDHLRTLNLAPLDAFLDQMFTDLVDRKIKFHALRSLGLPWMAVQSESFVPLLECAPFLQELHFIVRSSHRTVTVACPLPRHVLRNLSVLEAPDYALLFLLEGRGIRELSCSTVRDGGSLPTDIIKVFDALPLGTFRGLEKLALDLKCLSNELLDCLTRNFPRITTLSVDVRGMAWGPTPGSLRSHTTASVVAFFLSLQLPSTLEYLFVGKRYATVIRPAVRRVNGDDVLALRSHFPLNYPPLREANFYAANIHMKYERGNVTTVTHGKV